MNIRQGQVSKSVARAPDMQRFRLRHFVDALGGIGELDVVEQNLDLIDIAARLEGNQKSVHFRSVGAEKAELVGNVMASRGRLALAFGTPTQHLLEEVNKRLRAPISPVEVSSADAPVHQIVLTGADADLTRLPVHLQHGDDGAPYISAGIDFARNPSTGGTNLGCRRMMLRSPRTAGIDL